MSDAALNLYELADQNMEARRLCLQHDSQFYGPMKGTRCGCEVCKWARRFRDLSEYVLEEMRREATTHVPRH